MDSELEKKLLYTSSILSDLHSVWRPHKGQVAIGRALFSGEKKEVVLECGRKFGKTDALCYSLYRWALTNPGTFNYYFAPYKDQIKDLVWANGRLPEFLPNILAKKYIRSINNTEMRIVFKNGSYIRCDGSDNYEKSRGYSATGLTVYDEAKDFHMAFHEAFDPNRAITDAPLMAVGTPGHGNDLLSKLWDQANVSKSGAAFRMETSLNPFISAEFLARKEQEHRDRDEYDVFLLEYKAQRIKLGTKFVFPMLDKTKHMRPHDELIEYIKASRKDFDFYTGYDPGSAKCFAVGFFAVHRFNKHIVQLDEIYINKLGKNSTRQIIPICMDKWDEINRVSDDWQDCYDYAAAWFASEIAYEYPDYPHALFPCQKDMKNKEVKLSLMKDILLNGLFTFSDRCVKSFWEWENYKLNENGKVEKENDHILDLTRYVLNLANYYTIADAKPIDFKVKYEKGTFEEDEIRRNPKEGYGSYDVSYGD